MAERFDLAVVAMIRNPAAFASSIKRLAWGFDFRNWLDQELLMRDLLHPFTDEIVAMASAAGLHDARVVSGDELNARYFASRTDGLRTGSAEQLLVATT